MKAIVNFCLIAVVALLWCAGAGAAESGVVILFDQGHNQRFLIEEKGDLQLSGLAEIMRGSGARVASTKQQLNDETLKDISALVISGPFETVRPEEIDAIGRFVERGGRLAVMLHIGQPLTGLLAKFGVDHSNAVLHEQRNVIDKDINFRVSDLSASPLFSGLNQFSLYGCWALDPGKTSLSLARTSAETWADLDGSKSLSKGDAVSSFTVAVSGSLGGGGFVFFGDDALFQNRFLDENNRKLASNLSLWLSTGK